MNIVAIGVLVSLGVFACIFAWRAVSGARFNRFLRMQMHSCDEAPVVQRARASSNTDVGAVSPALVPTTLIADASEEARS